MALSGSERCSGSGTSQSGIRRPAIAEVSATGLSFGAVSYMDERRCGTRRFASEQLR